MIKVQTSWLSITSDVSESFLSSQSHKPFESELSKNFSSRVKVRVIIWSSQSQVTRTVESFRVVGLQARVSVESHEISHFFYDIFCYEMAPNML